MIGSRMARASAGRRGATALVIVALLLTGAGGAFARLQATLDAPSPATGHASVIATGVAAMPFDPIAWRVVRDTAEPLDQAQPVERALGFAVAEPDGIHVVNSNAGMQQRLARGEASFVAEGAVEQRASLTDENASYLRIALVAEWESRDPGNDELVFGGEAFTAPAGPRDIDLVRDVLAAGEAGAISGGDFPVLIVATAGSIDVSAAGMSPVTLEEGQAAELTGELVITGGPDAGAYVAGVIGPEVPAASRTSGTFTLGIILCEPGIAETAFGDPYDPALAARCEPNATGVVTELIAPDGSRLPLAEAEQIRPGIFAWTGLPFGVYGIASPTALPETVVDRAVYDRDGNLVPDAEAELTAEYPDIHLDLYLFQGAGGDGSGGTITVTVYNCPNGMAPDTLDPSVCTLATGGFDIALTNADSGEILGIEDATVESGAFIWSGLPVGVDYYIDQSLLPSGFTFWLADGANYPDGGGFYYVSLTAGEPSAAVTIYNLAEAAGTITLDTIVCPAAGSALGDCTRQFSPVGLGGIYLLSEDGGVELTSANASQTADGPYVWPNISLGFYVMDTGSLVPPEGYTIARVVLTPDGVDVSGGITLTEDVPIANIVVVLVPVEAPATANGTGSQGLAEANAPAAGTAAANPDSDGDCHTDGAEVAASTNPQDASSFPAGDCDAV